MGNPRLSKGPVHDDRLAGTVVRLKQDRGFGFIKVENGVDYFFHCTAYEGSFQLLEEGTKVTFTIGQGSKGPRAEAVRSA